MAIGYWLLAIGYWLLAIGYWLLAGGSGCGLPAVGHRRFRPGRDRHPAPVALRGSIDELVRQLARASENSDTGLTAPCLLESLERRGGCLFRVVRQRDQTRLHGFAVVRGETGPERCDVIEEDVQIVMFAEQVLRLLEPSDESSRSSIVTGDGLDQVAQPLEGYTGGMHLLDVSGVPDPCELLLDLGRTISRTCGCARASRSASRRTPCTRWKP